MTEKKELPPTRALTEEDISSLKEYLKKIDAVPKLDTPHPTDEEFEQIKAYFRGEGDLPAGFKIITIKEPLTNKEKRIAVHEEQDEIDQQIMKINAQYAGVIVKALDNIFQSGFAEARHNDVLVLLQNLVDGIKTPPALTENLLSKSYLPVFTGPLTNEIFSINVSDFKEVDNYNNTATLTTKNGRKITIENFDQLQGNLSISAQKILDTAIAYLTDGYYYGGRPESIIPTVEIPLVEYGEACGYQLTPRPFDTPEERAAESRRITERKKDLKRDIRRDLHDISSSLISGEEKKGWNKGDYAEMRIISSHRIVREKIIVNFDIEAAQYLARAYMGQYPTAMLKIDNRKPAAYRIGRKIAFHNSYDQNRAAGTENTLSVKSLLDSAPEIPSHEDLQSRKQRNWKDKIKKPLEKALDELVGKLLTQWVYRDPKTYKNFTSEEAQSLTWSQYIKLMVDFTMIDAPEQKERREKNRAAKEQAALESKAKKKKRGRPRKTEKS